jgi:hypothetical protein
VPLTPCLPGLQKIDLLKSILGEALRLRVGKSKGNRNQMCTRLDKQNIGK